MRSPRFLLILFAIMLLLDAYVFQAVKFLSQSATARTQVIIYVAYWALSALALSMLVVLPFVTGDGISRQAKTTALAVVAALYFAKLVFSLFLMIDDLRRVVQWAFEKVAAPEANRIAPMAEGVTRSVFLTWAAAAAAGSFFAAMVHGFWNRYRYRVHKVPLSFSSLPAAFKGLRVVQLSDIHSGSFTDPKAVQRGVAKIKSLQPDLILFTGDLVNNIAGEMAGYQSLFGELRAPLGIFSVLGNHDYGDYVEWENAAAKRANLEKLKNVHAAMGWKLLLNEHVVLQKADDKIALLGVENWSAKARFPKYGRLAAAYAGTENLPFKILLSHDPSHWDAQVRPEYGDIDLTLAGHTHGMQFGVELPWFKWSPVQYVYKQWAGLYEQGMQKLYVNRGFGFLGYPGRVGILPEITLFEFS